MLFGLQLCERILLVTENLIMALQNESMSAAEAQEIADLAFDTLKDMRNDDAFKLFSNCYLESIHEKTNTEEASLPRKCKAPRCANVGEGENFHSATIEEHYHQKYLKVLNGAIAGIEERFNQPGYFIYKHLRSLLIKNSKAQSKKIIQVKSKKCFPSMEMTFRK